MGDSLEKLSPYSRIVKCCGAVRTPEERKARQSGEREKSPDSPVLSCHGVDSSPSR